MNKIKLLITILILTVSTLSFSEVLEVYNWKAIPGKAQSMLNTMNEAAEIHNELGAHVSINILDVGSENQVDYILRFDDIQKWGAFKDKLSNDPKWNSFWNRVGNRPSGELQMSLSGFNTDPTVKASDFKAPFVYGVWVWDPAPGRTAEVIDRQQKYKKVHESLGARVEIYSEGSGGTGNFHYCLLFDTWSDWADWVIKANSSQELAELNSQQDPTAATLIRSFSGRAVVSN